MLDHRMVIGGIVAPHAHGVLLLQQVHLEHPVVLIPLKMAPKESKPIGHKNCVKQSSFPETQHNYEHNTTTYFAPCAANFHPHVCGCGNGLKNNNNHVGCNHCTLKESPSSGNTKHTQHHHHPHHKCRFPHTQ